MLLIFDVVYASEGLNTICVLVPFPSESLMSWSTRWLNSLSKETFKNDTVFWSVLRANLRGELPACLADCSLRALVALGMGEGGRGSDAQCKNFEATNSAPDVVDNDDDTTATGIATSVQVLRLSGRLAEWVIVEVRWFAEACASLNVCFFAN